MQPVRPPQQLYSKTRSVCTPCRTVGQFRDHSNDERKTKIREFIRDRTDTAFQCWLVNVNSALDYLSFFPAFLHEQTSSSMFIHFISTTFITPLYPISTFSFIYFAMTILSFPGQLTSNQTVTWLTLADLHRCVWSIYYISSRLAAAIVASVSF